EFRLDLRGVAVRDAILDLPVDGHHLFLVLLDVLHRRADLFDGDRQDAGDELGAPAVLQVVEDVPDGNPRARDPVVDNGRSHRLSPWQWLPGRHHSTPGVAAWSTAEAVRTSVRG